MGPISTFIFKLICFHLANTMSCNGRAHKTHTCGTGEWQIDSRSAHSLFSTFQPSKRRLDGLEFRALVLRRIGDKSTVPTFLLKTHFRMRRIYMGRNDDNSRVTLTIRTVPLSFLKSGTTLHHQPPTTLNGFLSDFWRLFSRGVSHDKPHLSLREIVPFYKIICETPYAVPTSP